MLKHKLEIAFVRNVKIPIIGYIRFLDCVNMGADSEIMILCPLELEMLSKLDFHGDPFLW